MTVNLQKLMTGYREEVEAYERILDLATRGAQLARAGSPLSALHEINQEKKSWLQRIESREVSLAADKELWRRIPRGSAEVRQLEPLLSRISELIELILHQERETDRWILQAVADVESRQTEEV